MTDRKKLKSLILRCLADDVTQMVECINKKDKLGERYIGYIEGKLAAFLIAKVISDQEYKNLFNQLADVGIVKKVSCHSLYQ